MCVFIILINDILYDLYCVSFVVFLDFIFLFTLYCVFSVFRKMIYIRYVCCMSFILFLVLEFV